MYVVWVISPYLPLLIARRGYDDDHHPFLALILLDPHSRVRISCNLNGIAFRRRMMIACPTNPLRVICIESPMVESGGHSNRAPSRIG